MKISYSWLKEYLAVDIAANDLAKHLSMLGFDVADLQTRGPQFTGVIVGRILDVQKHPNADRLSLCSVDNGKEKLSIVCGAKNVAAGARVLVAQIGATLPGGKKIERTKIRGTESQGMICSAAELGLPQTNGDGIMILPPDSPVGSDATQLFGQADQVLDVEITPNRGDCLSHYGLARELSIYFGCPLRPIPQAAAAAVDAGIKFRGVEIAARDACYRYLGRDFTELKVGPSPGWMVSRLEAVGLRSINNIVDITNYVLFELGHPLHAFDADKLQGDRIFVRFAQGEEKLKALDGNSYRLGTSDMVIADASGPVAIAGVIGGEPTSVTNTTQNAFLEAACFKGGVVRKTSKALKVRTDSSYRFERGTDPETAAVASMRATSLILQLCGGKQGALADTYPNKSEASPIEISTSRVNQILGSNYSNEKVEGVLKRLAANVNPLMKGSLLFTPPAHRLDIQSPWDIAEEVGRHLGYNSIPASAAPVKLQRPKSNPLVELIESLRDRLAAQGFAEAYNPDFVSAPMLAKCGIGAEKTGCISILNPLSEDYAYLRPTLLAGLLQSAHYNVNRGVKSLRLFEIGHTYVRNGSEVAERTQLAGVMLGDFPSENHWRPRKQPADFYDAKGIADYLLKPFPDAVWKPLAQQGSSLFHPKGALQFELGQNRIGVTGLLHPLLLKAWDLDAASAAAFVFEDLEVLSSHPAPTAHLAPISPFPSVTRDLSIVLDAAVPFETMRATLQGLDDMAKLELIDVFTGTGIPAGKKSLTLRLTFVRLDRTLRDSDISDTMGKAMERLAKDCGAKLRG